jgi:hypothetical protein
MRTEIILEFVESQHDIGHGLIRARHTNGGDNAAVVGDVASEPESIREGEQIGLASIGQIAEGAVGYGAGRHNGGVRFLDKINRISKLTKKVAEFFLTK